MHSSRCGECTKPISLCEKELGLIPPGKSSFYSNGIASQCSDDYRNGGPSGLGSGCSSQHLRAAFRPCSTHA